MDIDKDNDIKDRAFVNMFERDQTLGWFAEDFGAILQRSQVNRLVPSMRMLPRHLALLL